MTELFDIDPGAVPATALGALAMYVAAIAMIRITGKRAVAKMNNFDWIVTVAIGSITGSTIVSDSVSLIQGVTAIAVLLGLQWALTRATLASPQIAHLVKAPPRLLVCDGRMIESAMVAERVAPVEVQAALRSAGLHRLDQARWVVLESDATFSVIPVHHVRPGDGLIGNEDESSSLR